MSINAVNTARTGLYANQTRVDTAAHNTANLNTDNFRPATVRTTDTAEIGGVGQGTRVAGTYAPPAPGAATQPAAAPQPSAADPAKEMTAMTSAQRAYEANAAVVRTADQMTGALLDLTA